MARVYEKNMTEGNPLRLILSFTVPLLLGNLFQQTYNLVDTAIVGQTLGANALAAVGSSSSVQFLVLGFCQGFCLGLTIPIGQRFGAGDQHCLRRYEYTGGILAAVCALVMTFITTAGCAAILRALQVPEEIFQDAVRYLFIIFLEIPFMIMYNYLAGVIRAIGDSRTPFLFLAVASVMNIGLDFLFILAFHWGVAGAAAATVLSQAVSGFLCLLAILRRFPLLHIPPEDCSVRRKDVGILLGMAFPMGLQWSIVAIGSMIMQGSNNSLGTKYVSAFTAATRIKQFMLCPFDALASAVSTFVSQNYGASKPDRIREGVRKGTTVGILYGILAGGVLILCGNGLGRLFLSADSAEELALAALYMRRMGYLFWILGLLIVQRMALQGMGYAGRALFAGMMELAARSAVALTFAPVFGFGAITWTDQAAWAAAAVYCITMYQICERKTYRELTEVGAG